MGIPPGRGGRLPAMKRVIFWTLFLGLLGGGAAWPGRPGATS